MQTNINNISFSGILLLRPVELHLWQSVASRIFPFLRRPPCLRHIWQFSSELLLTASYGSRPKHLFACLYWILSLNISQIAMQAPTHPHCQPVKIVQLHHDATVLPWTSLLTFILKLTEEWVLGYLVSIFAKDLSPNSGTNSPNQQIWWTIHH